MVLTTSNFVDGYNVKEYLGIISAKVIISDLHLYGDKEKHDDLFNAELQKANSKLARRADSAGANAVISVNVNFEKGSGVIAIILTGTAVRIIPKD